VTALPARGAVWWCELAESGRQPVVVLSRDAADSAASPDADRPVHDHDPGIPSEVLLEPDDDPVPQTSVVNLDSVESVSLGALVERIGRLSDARMRKICEALEIAVCLQRLTVQIRESPSRPRPGRFVRMVVLRRRGGARDRRAWWFPVTSLDAMGCRREQQIA
jgi:mRNA interferase MazF